MGFLNFILVCEHRIALLGIKYLESRFGERPNTLRTEQLIALYNLGDANVYETQKHICLVNSNAYWKIQLCLVTIPKSDPTRVIRYSHTSINYWMSLYGRAWLSKSATLSMRVTNYPSYPSVRFRSRKRSPSNMKPTGWRSRSKVECLNWSNETSVPRATWFRLAWDFQDRAGIIIRNLKRKWLSLAGPPRKNIVRRSKTSTAITSRAILAPDSKDLNWLKRRKIWLFRASIRHLLISHKSDASLSRQQTHVLIDYKKKLTSWVEIVTAKLGMGIWSKTPRAVLTLYNDVKEYNDRWPAEVGDYQSLFWELRKTYRISEQMQL